MATFLLNTFACFISLLGFRGIRVLAHIFGFLAFDILRIRRKIILTNLNIVYGEKMSIKEKIRIGRLSFINFISTACEFIGAKYLLPKAIFEFENQKTCADIIARNQGLYAICMHFGNWEYLCHINAKVFSPVNVVVKDVLSGKTEQWIKNLRKYMGYKLTEHTGKMSRTEQIFKAIDHKEIVGFIVDQKRKNGQLLPFFGTLASTNDGLAKLYFRKNAPMIASNIMRVRPGHFKVVYSDEFIYEKDPTLSLAENITKFTLKINQFIEPIILSKPEEYYWLHNRWNIKKLKK